MSGWNWLGLTLPVAMGLLLFLKIVADELERVALGLRRLERQHPGELEYRVKRGGSAAGSEAPSGPDRAGRPGVDAARSWPAWSNRASQAVAPAG